MLCDSHLKSLLRVQKMCTEIVLQDTESYRERLGILMPELRMFSENLYKNHFLKVALDEHHSFIHLRLRNNPSIDSTQPA